MKFGYPILSILLFTISIFGCTKSTVTLSDTQSPFNSFRDIPGITEEEIASIEELRKENNFFTYGMLLSTDAFIMSNGEVGGYAAFFCEWLTGLFDIKFQPLVLESTVLLEKFNTGQIDFSGNIMPSIWGGYYAEAYHAPRAENIDTLVTAGISEASYIEYNDNVIEDSFPLVFNPVFISTANPALEPVVSVVTKAVQNGAMPHISYLFNKGYQSYRKHSISNWLTNEEFQYINDNPVISITAFSGNYPLCFYNPRYMEWQGIYFDLLDEISFLTGLSFKVVHDKNADWSVIYDMLVRGEAAVVPEMARTREREEHLIWSDIVILNDYYALISKSDFRNITFNEIQYVKIALIRNTNYAAMFRQWFPNHLNTVEYDSIDIAFAALQRGEVDMVMSTQRWGMQLTHFQEFVGYKTNIVFDLPIETRMGFNKEETILRSIFDKSLMLIYIDGITNQWTQMTYDYRAKVAEAQRPWLIGAVILSFIILLLILAMLYRSHKESKRLAKLVDEANEANRQKNASIKSMESILNSIDTMIYVTEPKTGEILFMNDSMKKHYAIEGDCVGKLCFKILQKDLDTICDFCPCYKLDKDPDNSIIWEEHSTLTERIYRNVDRYITWPNGHTVHIQHSVDMTELIAAKEYAEQSSRYKSAFLASMSHEIRTPMNAILGIAEIQLQAGNLCTEAEEAFSKIYESGDLLLNIINDILDLSKIEAGKLELVCVKYDIPSLINDTAQLIRLRYESKPIEFYLNVHENTPIELIGDELRIKQVLNNILSNAFKYTDEGNVELSVSVEPLQDDDVTIVFCISDTGQGMSENQISKLFDEYTRFNLDANRTTIGAGLGMSITQRLIDLMNGSISVQSEQGKGSVFTVRLPQKRCGSDVCGQELVNKLRTLSFHSTTVSKKALFIREYMPYGKILVVDDVESNLYVAKGMLMPYGLNVETASSGFEAIEKIKNGKVYDIVFMDHMMPKMDGIEATRILRDWGYTRYIVALTANALVGQAEIFLKSGFDAFVSKPIDSRELNFLLNDFIRNKQPIEVIEAARREKREKELKTAGASGDNNAKKSDIEKFFVLDAENAINTLVNIYAKLHSIESAELEMYVITIHGIKSALANIGETELSGLAAKLERAGKERDIPVMSDETPVLINALQSLITKFKPVKNNNDKTPENISAEDIIYLCDKLEKIKTACLDLNKKMAKAALNELKHRTWPDSMNSVFDKISVHLLHSEFNDAEAIAQTIIEQYSQE